MNEGWIKLNRKMFDSWLWGDKPFSRGQAWIDLIGLANWKDVKVPYKGEMILCQRGDVNYSMSFLADRWGWSRKKVKSFLTLLEGDGMVTTNVTTNRTVITVENYSKYQDRGTTNVTTEESESVPTKEQRGNSEGTAKEQRAHTNEERKERKEGGERKDIIINARNARARAREDEEQNSSNENIFERASREYRAWLKNREG